MDVYRNMSFGLKIHGATKSDIDRKVRDTAKVLHIDHLLDRLLANSRAGSASEWRLAEP